MTTVVEINGVIHYASGVGYSVQTDEQEKGTLFVDISHNRFWVKASGKGSNLFAKASEEYIAARFTDGFNKETFEAFADRLVNVSCEVDNPYDARIVGYSTTPLAYARIPSPNIPAENKTNELYGIF